MQHAMEIQPIALQARVVHRIDDGHRLSSHLPDGVSLGHAGSATLATSS